MCKTRIVYRIEHRETGSGPYPSYHGTERGTGIEPRYVFGCHTLDAVRPWLEDLRDGGSCAFADDPDSYVVRAYRVPLKHVYDKPRRWNDASQHCKPPPYYGGWVTHYELQFAREHAVRLATLPLSAVA